MLSIAFYTTIGTFPITIDAFSNAIFTRAWPHAHFLMSLVFFSFLTCCLFYVSNVIVPTWSSWLLAMISAVLAALLICSLPNPLPKSRRASFFSRAMAEGGYPKSYGVPHAVVQGVFEVENAPKGDALRKFVADAFLFYTRFRSKPEYSSDGSIMKGWVEVNVNLEEHVKELNMENREEMQAFVDEQAAQSVRLDRPLWELFVIRVGGEKPFVAVLARIHHAIGDGISLVQMFLRMFRNNQGKTISLDHITAGAKNIEKRNKKMNYFLAAQKFFEALGKVLTLPASEPDTQCCIRTWPFKWTGVRKCVVMPSLLVSELKQIKEKAGVTINDVMVGLLTGTVRRYLEFRKDPALESKMSMRALIPFAFPRKLGGSDPNSLRNLWCFLSLDLPINFNSTQVAERIQDAHVRMEYLKSSPEAYLQLKVNEIAGALLPSSITSQTVLDLITKHSMVFTNVPGPNEEMFWSDQAVTDLQIPIGNIIPQMSAFSYNGSMKFSMTIDPNVFTNSEKLNQFYLEEFQAMQKKFA